jgi:hypothetical protein
MKTTFKILLTLTGMLSAVLITSSNLKANEKTIDKICSCRCGSSLSDSCGRTASGTIIYGTFYETISSGVSNN